MLLSTREIWSSWGGSSRELWRWLYWVWASWSSFSLCSLPWAELCIDNWKGVDNPRVFGLLLSSAGTSSGCFSNFPSPPPRSWGCARCWGGTQPGQLTKAVWRAIPYHMTSSGIWKIRKGGWKGKHSLCTTFAFWRNCYMRWSPGFWEVPRHDLPMGSFTRRDNFGIFPV